MRRAAPKLRHTLLLAFLFSVPPICSATVTGDEVLFAGHSFLVDAAQIEQRFPLVTAVLREGSASGKERSIFDGKLSDTVLRARPKHFVIANRDGQTQGDTRKGIAKALSLAFSHESVELQQMAKETVAVYDVVAQVLFFDYGSAAPHIIASYPVRLRYTDITAQPPNQARQVEVMRAMLDTTSEKGLVQVWLRKMTDASARAGDRLVQVEMPRFDEKIWAKLPHGRERAEQDTARFLEGLISDEWQVPIVPLVPGQAIRGKMVQVFSNGDATEFTLPEPSYTVSTTVRDLRKAEAPVEGGTRVAYGAFVTSAVKGPLGPVAELRLKDVLSVTLPKVVEVKLDDWEQMNRSLQSVLAQFVQQVTSSDRSWTKQNSATPDATAQLDAIRSKILTR